MTSLPEPVSPRISTGTSEGATSSTRSMHARRPDSAPTIDSLRSCRPSRESSDWLSASAASRSPSSSRHAAVVLERDGERLEQRAKHRFVLVGERRLAGFATRTSARPHRPLPRARPRAPSRRGLGRSPGKRRASAAAVGPFAAARAGTRLESFVKAAGPSSSRAGSRAGDAATVSTLPRAASSRRTRICAVGSRRASSGDSARPSRRSRSAARSPATRRAAGVRSAPRYLQNPSHMTDIQKIDFWISS